MKSADCRDYSKTPPALLNPESVLKLRAMVRLCAYVGDIPFPYVEAMFRHGKTEDWIMKK